ncbi:hypothetical protein QE152_g19993 [Popillia japonica]|uniref:Endonuclease-reverse transcriptase n=1 Tax=Popillia japonica TaxID=7064 RepID=A0AAW1KMC8_POPJA
MSCNCAYYLSKTEVQCIKKKLNFYCDTCIDVKSQLSKIRELTDTVSILQNEITSLKEKLSPLTSNFDQTRNPFEGEDIIREVSERKHRKNNLVIFNLSELSNASREEQCAGDLETARKVFFGLGVTANILDSQRVGRFDPTIEDRKRPFKITLSDSNMIPDILRKAKERKKSEKFKVISISKDRTTFQVKLYKIIKEQLNTRLAVGESDLFIKYVRDIPRIVSGRNQEN